MSMIRHNIYGAGHLAEALLEGRERVDQSPIRVFNRSAARLERLRATYSRVVVAGSAAELAVAGGLVFLMIPARGVLTLDAAFLARARETEAVLVSCANGLTLRRLEEGFPGVRWIRALPNVLWRIGQGTTLAQYGRRVSSEDRAALRACLDPVSALYEARADADFDRLGTLTSCGPALVAETLRQIGEAFELRDEAERDLCVRTVLATAAYLVERGKSAEAVIQEVANPGGLSEVGVIALRDFLPAALIATRDRLRRKQEDRRRDLAMTARLAVEKI